MANSKDSERPPQSHSRKAKDRSSPPSPPADADAVLGIDLGTTNTVCAVAHNGKVRIISPNGERIIPSVLAVDKQGQIQAGALAQKLRQQCPEAAVFSAKRLLGRSFDAPQVSRMVTSVPYRIVKGKRDSTAVKLRGRTLSIEEVSASLLSYAKQCAEQSVGQPIRHAVVAVPSNFSNAQRYATQRAAKMAGLETLRIISEPTAAALAYRDFSSGSQRVAVYDLGGGTFDMSILELSPGCARVLATAGDMFLGGDDMDQAIISAIFKDYRKQFGFDLTINATNLSILQKGAQALKMALGGKNRAKMQLAAMHPQQTRPFEFILSRDAFEDMITPILRRTLSVCEDSLRGAGLGVQHIDQVVLVGGPTQIPSVRKAVADFFGKSPDIKANPLTAVAVGAAIQGAAVLRSQTPAAEPDPNSSNDDRSEDLSSQQADADTPESLLIDVTPKSLGVRTVGGQVDMLIERNAAIPLEQTRRFTTTYDAQHRVKIEICEGESLHFGENLKLGEVELHGLPPAKRGRLCIAVTFAIDSDGLLTVHAEEADSGKQTQTSLQVFGLAA